MFRVVPKIIAKLVSFFTSYDRLRRRHEYSRVIARAPPTRRAVRETRAAGVPRNGNSREEKDGGGDF